MYIRLRFVNRGRIGPRHFQPINISEMKELAIELAELQQADAEEQAKVDYYQRLLDAWND